MHTIDPRGSKVGGIETHIRLILAHHPADVSVLLVGVDEVGDLAPGRVVALEVAGRRIDFLPVTRAAPEGTNVAAKRLLNSLTLRYVAGALRHLGAIRRAIGPGPASFDLHRYEYAPVARLLGRPAVQMIHGEGRRDDAMDSLTRRYWFVHRAAKRIALGSAARVLCVNRDLVTDLETESPAAAAKADVMTVSVDTERFRPTPSDHADGEFRVVFAGRLDAFKDPPLMFAALARLRERLGGRLAFHYVGATDPWRYPEFGVVEPFTIRHGPQDAEGVAAVLRRSHAGILTSHFEGMPCFLLEGLASGRPFAGIHLPQYDEVATAGSRFVPRLADRDAAADAVAEALAALWSDVRADRVDPQAVAAGAAPFSVGRQMGRLFALHGELAR